MRRRAALRELGPWYVLGVLILKPFTLLFTRRHWSGFEHVPARGGVILAANHISHADPPVLADFVVFGVGRARPVPGQELAVQGQRAGRARHARGQADPGLPRDRRTRLRRCATR